MVTPVCTSLQLTHVCGIAYESPILDPNAACGKSHGGQTWLNGTGGGLSRERYPYPPLLRVYFGIYLFFLLFFPLHS